MRRIIALAPAALIAAMVGNVQAATQADVMLQGTIADTTCEVTANHGAATLNVGAYAKTQFTAAKKQVGSEPLFVTLKNCSPDANGALQVTGVVGTEKDVFLSDIGQAAGFMLTPEDSTTAVANGVSIPVTADKDGSLEYTFTAGMAVLNKEAVQPGSYHAPIKISYVSN
ncbi:MULTISPECIES: fimbrial protein [Serratia]|uniref:Type 1 fimbrial protein n=2 Tax=Serratia TaxID=613 RepID=A0AAE7JW43_SERFO|nr:MULTISPECIES: type 1 fimbrial protein [Serratia]QKJ61527.1 type 1 fimbrial protein [Serratia fonticola]